MTNQESESVKQAGRQFGRQANRQIDIQSDRQRKNMFVFYPCA